MPRTPILPTLDWASIFNRGIPYLDWLKKGESNENRQKMESIRKGLTLSSSIQGYLSAILRPIYIIAIAEDWCGDVVRHVPVLQKITESSSQIDTRYLGREDAKEAFVRFLTNGGEAIPKFIFLNKDFVECGNWGPMPLECREWIARGKACGDVKTAREKVAAFYDLDNDLRIVVNELVNCIDIATTSKI